MHRTPILFLAFLIGITLFQASPVLAQTKYFGTCDKSQTYDHTYGMIAVLDLRPTMESVFMPGDAMADCFIAKNEEIAVRAEQEIQKMLAREIEYRQRYAGVVNYVYSNGPPPISQVLTGRDAEGRQLGGFDQVLQIVQQQPRYYFHPIQSYLQIYSVEYGKEGGPDLTPGPLSPVAGAAGVPMTFRSVITNQGNEPANNFRSTVWFIKDVPADPWSIIPGEHIGFFETNELSLSASESGVASLSYTFPEPGAYKAKICADFYESVWPESDESNNCGPWTSITITAEIPSELADLSAGSVSVSPTVAGSPTTLSAMVSNTGMFASEGFPVLFQVSENGALVSSSYLAGLAPGGTGAGSASYTFPAAGTYTVRACANFNSAWDAVVTESDYANNCGAWTAVTVTEEVGPSCTFSASPASISAGQSTTLVWNCTETTSCTGSGFTAGGASGSATVSPTTSTGYGLSCTGPGGTTSPTAPVTVTPATSCSTASVADIRANGNDGSVRVAQDDSVTISWTASGILNGSCTISGPGVNQTSSMSAAPACSMPSGSVNQTVSTQSVYRISCTDGTQDSVIVNVTPRIIEF